MVNLQKLTITNNKMKHKKEEKMQPNIRLLFILDMGKTLPPARIEDALIEQGFDPISRSRIWQILTEHGIKPVLKRYWKKSKKNN